MLRRRIFTSEKLAWAVVFFYIIVLYSTLGIAFDLYVSVYDQVGKETVSTWMNGSFVLTGTCLLLVVIIFLRPKASGYVAIVLICLCVAFCLDQLTVPAKRFHFFQYAPLTILVFDALRFRISDHGIYIWVMAIVSFVGLGDETVQWLLPDRHFGIPDLVINSTAGLLTLVFIGFVLKEENYPWPGRREE
jgi:VanZ family protein